MRSSLTLLAAVCAASLALSTSASAATVLQFSQQTSTDFVSATVSGSTTTLNTNGPAGSTSIPITITQLGVLPNQNISAFETFLPALNSTSSTTGGVQNGFSGTIIISTLAGGGGQNFLTAVITNGQLNANGMAGGFNASTGTTNGGNPSNVILTSANLNVQTALGGPGPVAGAASLSFVNITPAQGGAGFVSFTAQNTGNFSTAFVIPEPASFLSAGTAVLAGLGCFGWSRRKSSKA
jgi:hypothetical protein